MAVQITAGVIFIVMFILIVSEAVERHRASLLCGLVMLVLVQGIMMRDADAVWRILSLDSFVNPAFWFMTTGESEAGVGINWATIIFICGMMIMVEGMGKSGFFRWLCLRLSKAVDYRPGRLFVMFMILAAALSMFIDSITVILFLSAVTAELASLLRLDPIPFITGEIFCANLGGTATMCGDPPNIIIGTALNYTFTQFITHTGWIAGAVFVIILMYFFLTLHKKLKIDVDEQTAEVSYPSPETAVKDKKAFAVSCVIFFAAVVMLATHASTGLTVSAIGVIIAAATLLTSRSVAAFELVKAVDYKTLLFFIGLFIVVGGLEVSGILDIIASLIASVGGGNLYLTVAIVIWMSALCSAFIDNIPFAATMVPIIKSLAATHGFPLDTLAWTLSVGTDIGGNATPIGASANVVGISVAAKNGHLITWRKFCRYAVPATLISVTASMLFIFAAYC